MGQPTEKCFDVNESITDTIQNLQGLNDKICTLAKTERSEA